MAETLEIESTKRQLTRDILRDLGVEEALRQKYTNIQAQASQLIDEYGKYYLQLYPYINNPFETKQK